MCGVAFMYNDEMNTRLSAEKMKQCLEQLSHRGPDCSAISVSGQATVGQSRLSIIDLDGSHQPMSSSDGRYILTYNGEIYNFKELRSSLTKGWEFKSEGDTETLLAGLVMEGSTFINKVEGMFAFVLWDSQNKTLLAGRDRIGKKPLFYQQLGKKISIASELPALRKLTDISWSECLDSTADYLRHGFFLPGTTAYNEVKELRPGHLLNWSQHDGVVDSPHWRLKVGGYTGSKAQAVEQCRELMNASMKRRMVADVEVGAFLSGGVDSSLVVALMQSTCGVTPKTFSIGFSQKAYDETRYARQISKKYDTEHYERCMTDWDTNRLVALITNHVGQPFADSSILPTAMVCDLASEHVKVALSGDGGDELFSGYERYKVRAYLGWYMALPLQIRKTVKALIHRSARYIPAFSGPAPKILLLALDVLERSEDETPYTASLMYQNESFSVLAPDLADKGHRPPVQLENSNLHDVQAMMQGDALVYLPQDILVKVDRASMAHSLETRSPFLDTELVEHAFSLPLQWHRTPSRGKQILKNAFQHLLPKEIWNRKKQGFGVPLHEWFRTGLEFELQNLIDQYKTPISKQFLEQMITEHTSNQRDHGFRLWNIYSYMLCQSRTY